MKKIIGVLGAVLLFSSSMNAATPESSSTSELVMFCDAGWRAVDAYYNNGGDDGFVAAQIFEAVCNYQ